MSGPTDGTPDRLLLRINEAARVLGVSRSLLYQELDRTIPVVRIGRSVRIPRAWLERMIAERVAEFERARAAADGEPRLPIER